MMTYAKLYLQTSPLSISPYLIHTQTSKPWSWFTMTLLLSQNSFALLLSLLQNLLLLSYESGRGADHRWPHIDFLGSFSGSKCSLKRLRLVFESLSPEQLIEVLESPAVKGTLVDLSVHTEWDATPIVNDNVVEKLTFSPSSEGNPIPGLCPRSEMMSMRIFFCRYASIQS
jgi:hypothetical protein